MTDSYVRRTVGVTQVILANEDSLARDILRHAFAHEPITLVAEPTTIDALCAAAAKHPDAVVLADALLEDVPIEEVTRHLPAETHVIIMSSETSAARVANALNDSVRGYLVLDASPDEVVFAVNAVARGGVALNPTAASLVLDHYRQRNDGDTATWRGRPLFTPRESDVLGALVEGMSTKSIARRLGIATKTVENHKLRIFDKLGVRTQAQAVVAAARHGLISTAVGANGDSPNGSGIHR